MSKGNGNRLDWDGGICKFGDMAFVRFFLFSIVALTSVGSAADSSVTPRVGSFLYEQIQYRRVLPNGRYEPTRPGQELKTAVGTSYQSERRPSTPSNSIGRFTPRRPQERVAEAQSGSELRRYQPRRPSRLEGGAWNDSSKSGSNFLKTATGGYNQVVSVGNRYLQIESMLSGYEIVTNKNVKGLKLGKTLLKPVKFAFKLSKKTVSKVAIKSWLPFL